MTSYADDNRSLFTARNRKYAVSYSSSEAKCPTQSPSCSRTETTHTATTQRPRTATRSNETQSTLGVFWKQYRDAVDEHDKKVAAKNAKTIAGAMRAGVKKVDYSYDDYAVEEHNFPISFAALAVAFTVIVVFLLLNWSQITKYTNDIFDLKSEMTSYSAEIAEYEILLGKRTDHTTVEAYASAAGLVSSDKVESRYVSMTDNYKLEKANGAQDGGYTVSTAMSGVIRLFSEALGG